MPWLTAELAHSTDRGDTGQTLLVLVSPAHLGEVLASDPAAMKF